jgi:hypothetical protein
MRSWTAQLLWAGLCLAMLTAELQAARVAVAPISGGALSAAEARVARSLLVHDLQKAKPRDLVVELAGDPLPESPPVLELLTQAREAGADELVLLSADRLGDKLMLQVRLLETAGERNLLTDAMPVASVEDLDTAMERMAAALARRQPVAEGREVGSVLENEGLNTRRRTAIHQSSLTAGYLWPIGEISFNGKARAFTAAWNLGIEDRSFDAGYSVGWRQGPALLLYSHWLSRPRDICPFVGGAAGFHWVRNKDDRGQTSLDDGFHTAAQAGLILFRTYDFQMVLQGEYAVTWNDTQDRAWFFSLGIRP